MRTDLAVLPLTLLLTLTTFTTASDEDPPTFTVTATDPAGEPIAGADVWFTDAVEVRERGTTDESGVVLLEVSCPDRCHVRVEADGYAPWTSEKLEGATSAAATPTPGASIAGAVFDRDTGDPIPGVVVRLHDRSSAWWKDAGLPSVTTGESGMYRIDHVPAGRVGVTAVGPGYAVTHDYDISVPEAIPDPESPPFSIDPMYLGPGVRISGVVRDADGPVEGATVVALAAVPRENRPASARTADDGTFAIDGVLVGAELRVAVETAGEYARAKLGPYETRAGQDIDDLVVTLFRGGSLTFSTVGPDGETVRPDHVRAGADGEFIRGARLVETEEGFVIHRIAPGRHAITITATGYVPWEGPEVVIRNGETAGLGEIVLRVGEAIAGRVVDADGEPVPEAHLRGSWQDAERGWVSARADTAEDGTFRMTGIDGAESIRVDAYHDEFMGGTGREVAVGAEDVEFKMSRGGTIRGTVELAAGGVPDKVRVTRHPTTDSESVDDPLRVKGAFPTTSDPDVEDGTFELSQVPEGRYTLSVRAVDTRATRVEDVVVSESRTTDTGPVRLEPGVTLRGQVVAGDDLAPVAAVSIVVETPRGMGWMPSGTDRPDAVVSDVDGAFEVRGLDPGAVVLKASHPSYAPTEERLTLEDAVEQAPAVVHMSRGGTITGTVRGDDGSPVAGDRLGVLVGFMPTDDRQEAGEDGTYRFEHVPPGSVQVARVRPGNPMPEMKPATVREGEVTVVDFGNAAPIVWTGRLLVGDEPVAAAEVVFVVVAENHLADPVATRSDADGRFQAGFHRPGGYLTMATRSDSGAVLITEIEVPDRPTIEQDIVFPSASIAGSVVDADGAPVAGAQIVAHRPSQPVVAPPHAYTDDAGAFRIEGLSPATYDVIASAEGLASGTRPDVVVGSGQQVDGVVFELDSGRFVRGVVVDPAGSPIPDAIVSVSAVGGTGFDAGVARTDVNGRFVSNASSDDVEIEAFAQGWALGKATGESGATAAEAPEITVRLTAGGTLVVRAVDSDGDPLVGATLAVVPQIDEALAVMFLVTGGAPIVTDAAGNATLTSLPSATYDVGVTGVADAENVQVDVADGEVATVTLTVQSP